MTNSLMLASSHILLAGSISNATENALIDRAHEFVDAFVEEVLKAGGGFVIYVAAEPVNSDNKPLLFDWTVARAIDKLLPDDSQQVRLKIVASQERLQSKANPEQRRLLLGMIARGVAELVPLEEEVLTGGNVGDEQIEHATAMVALGGGKGVLDRARKMSKRQLPVLPLDLQLGANSEDGKGAIGILKSFQTTPLTYMPNSGNKVIKTLTALSLQDPVMSISDISKRIVKIFYEEELARVQALPPDVLVLTALDVELAAAKQAFGIAEDAEHTTTENGLHIWKTPVSKRSGKTASCVLACFAGAGNVDAASVTSMLLGELRPANVMMLGIAAGLRDKCALGEVVIAERVVAYEGATFLEEGRVENRPEISRLSMRVRQDVSSYLSNRATLEFRLTESYRTLGIEFPDQVEAGPVIQGVMPKTATVASGEKLLRDPDKFLGMRELHGKTEVAEMEGAGLFAACANFGKPVLMIRGISDFGDSKKDNRFHLLAAKAAAAVTVDYIAHGMTLQD
ncbi:TPA: 5'-methylthioadenosine/S-adenosylhomocysteine nucleosidase [Escherichia coli]|uniref:phosphorylase family protein n=1 Tax=Escherichia coli TaxID=562 RepID=UPI00164F8C60|nr:phosphorylase [Escherichia coli]EFI7699078.1 5'-methylthioadenosine/S-adenosylhomocysteine nucleosidase [Escherichia coli]EHJ4620957.1 purine phosphorylase [Escherichia coli]EHM1947904.1 purine phosphorylase [Escherichia coli]EJM1981886.1 purine phosphorylase [Escherichia coli]EKL8876276.1 purine phosphorylase [Escherichia coli]